MPAGDLDISFAGDGKSAVSFRGTDIAHAELVQSNGRIVLAGGGGPAGSFRVARLRTDGRLDTTARSCSPASRGPGGGNIQVARLNPNGALDATFGTGGKAAVDFGGDDFGLAMARQANVAVARLNANGSPDTAFGTAGKATVDLGVATFGNAVALQANGRIVVAGQRTGGDDFAVAPLLG
jgi:uncharacterized delta-60 repeat protein